MVKRCLIVYLCIFACLIGGCWDSTDVEDMSLAIIGGYDLNNPDPHSPHYLNVSTIIPVLAKEAKQKYFIDTVDGLTAGDSRANRSWRIDKKYVPSNLQVMVFNEALARQGLAPIMDFTWRDARFINTVPLAVVEGTARELMRISPERDPNPGFFIRDLIKRGNQGNFIVNMNLQQFAHNVYNPGLSPILPLIKTYKNPDALLPGKSAKISGCAIFKQDKMIAKVGLRESVILALLHGWPSEGYLSQVITAQGGAPDRITIQCTNDRKVTVHRVGKEYYFTVTVLLNGRLYEHTTMRPIDAQYLRQIETAFAKSLRQQSMAFIAKMQDQFHVDCIDITEFALAKWRHELKGQDFTELLKHYHIKVAVKVNINDTGELE